MTDEQAQIQNCLNTNNFLPSEFEDDSLVQVSTGSSTDNKEVENMLETIEIETLVYPLLAEEPTDALELYVLGKSPAWQDTNGACSGYLVHAPVAPGESDYTLIDCGNGVVSQLQRYINPSQLSAVFISHFHADHYFDLVPLAYLLKYSPYPHGLADPKDAGSALGPSSLSEEFANVPDRKPRLYVPENGIKKLRELGELWHSPNMIKDSFDVIEYEKTDKIKILDTVSFQLAPVPHLMPTVAVDVQAQNLDGSVSRFTYGADCGRNENLETLAKDSPLLIAEATMPEDIFDRADLPAFHMSAHQAGQTAKAANSRELMITHFSERYSDQWLLEQVAKSKYPGRVHLASSGVQFTESLKI